MKEKLEWDLILCKLWRQPRWSCPRWSFPKSLFSEQSGSALWCRVSKHRAVRIEAFDLSVETFTRIESLESRVSINTSESLSKSVRLLLENRKIVSKFFDSSIICFCYFNPTVKPICWKFAFQWRNVSIETFEWKLSSKNFSANPCSRTTTLQTFRNRPSALLQTPLKLSGSFEWEFFSVLKIDEFSIQNFWIKTTNFQRPNF